jgi:hypothetical protein
MTAILNVLEDLKPNTKELHVIIAATIISLIARWAAFFPLSYALDDYSNALSLSCVDLASTQISQGRWGAYFLNRALELVGFYVYHYSITGFAISSICLILSGILICRIWNIKDAVPMFLTVIFIVIHPYQVEYFTFKIASLFGLPIFLSLLAFYLCAKNRIWYVASAFLIAFALSIYQLALNYMTMVLLLSVIGDLVMQYKRNSVIEWNILNNNNYVPVRFSIIPLSVLLYVGLSGIVIMAYGATLVERADLLPFESIGMRLSQLALLGKEMFFTREPLMPLPYKTLFSFIFVSFFVLAFRNWLSLKDNRKFLSLCLVVFLSALSLLNIVGMNLAIKDWWPVPRILSTVSVFWAGFIAFAYVQTRNSAQRALILVPAIVLLLGAIAINNTVLAEQLRVNMRDAHKANRIIERLERHPEFGKVNRVAIVGGTWRLPSGIRTVTGDLNVSAFGAPWSRLAILNEISGYNFFPATNEEDKYAEEHCSSSHKWPHEDALTVRGNLAVLCF